jgi:hypothetical protein
MKVSEKPHVPAALALGEMPTVLFNRRLGVPQNRFESSGEEIMQAVGI